MNSKNHFFAKKLPKIAENVQKMVGIDLEWSKTFFKTKILSLKIFPIMIFFGAKDVFLNGTYLKMLLTYSGNVWIGVM